MIRVLVLPVLLAFLVLSPALRAAGGAKAGAAASSDDDPGDDYAVTVRKASIPDPAEPVNRGTFWFNHQLYHYVFHPLNEGYKFLLPRPVRTGLANAIDNTEHPVRFVNDLLQWKPPRAGLETEKFLYNSTVGVGGILKPSDKVSWLAEIPRTDTSATFAKWGIPHGCYLVWPVLGPKSIRDTVGFAGDVALNPLSWLTYGIIGGATGVVTTAASATETVSDTSDKVDAYETVTKTSVDRYLAVKSAYLQNRNKVESASK
jgi:phospholipid-binding lipoprotein MlaA